MRPARHRFPRTRPDINTAGAARQEAPGADRAPVRLASAAAATAWPGQRLGGRAGPPEHESESTFGCGRLTSIGCSRCAEAPVRRVVVRSGRSPSSIDVGTELSPPYHWEYRTP